ncbi:MAG TPA: DNA repair protein RecN [Pseudogracilibacillus sp.]|nr:DNA repair protein RecN [Pseudogracilibacillus sp.]
MLTELSIKNFAIIDDISIAFDKGLTVLTGETGAGKSIIIDAVQLLAGARASVEFVRHGEKKAEIIGLFDIETKEIDFTQGCEEHGIDYDPNELFIMERTITSKGKSICRINGKIVPLHVLRNFGMSLLNVHSQHDHVHLMDKQSHLHLLDAYGGKEIEQLKSTYGEKYREYIKYKKEYDDLNESEQQLAHRLDLLKFQADEISAAELLESEDDYLEQERNELQNYASIHDALVTAYEGLYGDGKALEWVDVAAKALQNDKIAQTPLAKKAEELMNIYYTLEEVTFDIRNYQEGLFYDENRLNDIESRLNTISFLKRKYGQTVNDIIAYHEKINIEIEKLENHEAHHDQLIEKIAKLKQEVLNEGVKLHKARVKTAKGLCKDIEKELKDLYLEHTLFDVGIEQLSDSFYESGIDDVQFLLATNKGEPVKPLHKIASGGEISRIMLALKKIFAKHDEISTVIFDEIDTGVSGRVAQSIAEKMYEITKDAQVLCITHLAQVAAMSDQHVLIEKSVKNNRTSTEITFLSTEEKTKEIAKMITGAELTETAVQHAVQLLDLTKSYKESV